MAYDEALALRIRDYLGATAGVTEKKMFGGIAFLLDGNMCVGVVGEELIARVGVDAYDKAVARSGARPMDFTGRPMSGWITVAPTGLKGRALGSWIEQCKTFVQSLPAK